MHVTPLMPLGGVLRGTLPNPNFSADAIIQDQVFGRRSSGSSGNLTGPITSSNGVTAVASQTGTGSKFVMDTTPSLSSTLGVGGATASASGAGITFPATQSASSDVNTLDDYEEGTFTPTIISSGGGTPTYSAQAGFYTKVGNVPIYNLRISLATLGTLAAGTITIGGLPFTSNATANNESTTSVFGQNLAVTATTAIMARIPNSFTSIAIFRFTAGVAVSLTVADLTGTSIFIAAGNYQT